MTDTTFERALVVQPTETKRGWAGQSVPRKEDQRLVQGEGVFFDDLKRHGMGFLHFVRSPYAHAKIKSIDVSKALELGGVYGTLTGDEVAILTDPFFELSTPPGADMKDYALAVGKVRHMGEPVAASSPPRARSRATRPTWSRSSTNRRILVTPQTAGRTPGGRDGSPETGEVPLTEGQPT